MREAACNSWQLTAGTAGVNTQCVDALAHVCSVGFWTFEHVDAAGAHAACTCEPPDESAGVNSQPSDALQFSAVGASGEHAGGAHVAGVGVGALSAATQDAATFQEGKLHWAPRWMLFVCCLLF